MRALLGDLFPGLCSCCVCLPETLEWPICGPALPYTSLILGNSLLPRLCWAVIGMSGSSTSPLARCLFSWLVQPHSLRLGRDLLQKNKNK